MAPAEAPHPSAPPAAPGAARWSNGPAKLGVDEATMQPLADSDETHEVTAPPMLARPSAPKRTLLGMPAQEVPGAPQLDRDGRTTRPLAPGDVAHANRGARSDFDEDERTEVQAAATVVDDLPTSRTGRAEPDLEEARTIARPAPRSRPLDPVATTLTANLPQPRSSGSLHSTAALPAAPTRLTQTPSLAPTRPTRLPSGQLPEPLPPSPRLGDDEDAMPWLDVGPTPAAAMAELPPMPEHPASGSIVDAVKYLMPLATAIWARRKAQDAIRALLHGDQRLLDSVLRDLGRVAREEGVNVPALADEMRRVVSEEERRNGADKQIAAADAAMKKKSSAGTSTRASGRPS